VCRNRLPIIIPQVIVVVPTHGNRVPVYRLVEKEFSIEDTEEREDREHNRISRAQERQRGGAHVKGSERVDVGLRARSTPMSPGRNVCRSKVRGQGCQLCPISRPHFQL
jgi:hypothetical protein